MRKEMTTKNHKGINKVGGVSRKLPKNKARIVPLGISLYAPTSSSVIEALKRFEVKWKRMINGGMGKRTDMKGRWTWVVGDDEDDEAYVDESLMAFLSTELTLATTQARESVLEEIWEWNLETSLLSYKAYKELNDLLTTLKEEK